MFPSAGNLVDKAFTLETFKFKSSSIYACIIYFRNMCQRIQNVIIGLTGPLHLHILLHAEVGVTWRNTYILCVAYLSRLNVSLCKIF